MKYPFFASFIVFCLTLMYTIFRIRNKEAKEYQKYIDEETKANNTRRKPLDNLNYITIPFDTLPMDVLATDETVSDYHNTLKSLSENPIVNLTGLSNTELKLQYGAPNLDILSSYDQSYTILARTLNDWAHFLYENDYIFEAKNVLEFSISTNTDVTASYILLAQIYKSNNNSDKIKELIKVASQINSLMSKNIVKKLESMLD